MLPPVSYHSLMRITIILSLLAAALGLAACGSSQPNTGGATTDQGNTAAAQARSLAFSRCMRSHGVPNFPDPNAQGDLAIGPSSGLDPGSAKFQAALRACQKVLPNGGQPTPQQLAKARQGALAFSACMRSHGLPDFPDPTFSSGGGGIGIRAHMSAGSDLNPQSPTFQSAQRACQGHLPFKGAGARTSSGAERP